MNIFQYSLKRGLFSHDCFLPFSSPYSSTCAHPPPLPNFRQWRTEGATWTFEKLQAAESNLTPLSGKCCFSTTGMAGPSVPLRGRRPHRWAISPLAWQASTQVGHQSPCMAGVHTGGPSVTLRGRWMCLCWIIGES